MSTRRNAKLGKGSFSGYRVCLTQREHRIWDSYKALITQQVRTALWWGFSPRQVFFQILKPLPAGRQCVLAGIMPRQHLGRCEGGRLALLCLAVHVARLALFSLLCLCFQQHSWGSSPGQLQSWSQTSLMGLLCQMCSLLLEENRTD